MARYEPRRFQRDDNENVVRENGERSGWSRQRRRSPRDCSWPLRLDRENYRRVETYIGERYACRADFVDDALDTFVDLDILAGELGYADRRQMLKELREGMKFPQIIAVQQPKRVAE